MVTASFYYARFPPSEPPALAAFAARLCTGVIMAGLLEEFRLVRDAPQRTRADLEHQQVLAAVAKPTP